MIKKIVKLLNLVLVISLFACSKSHSGYKIVCQIEGLSEGTVLELFPAATHKNEKSIAMATVSEGKFTFEGELEEPRLFRISVSGDNSYGMITLMVENSEISVKGKALCNENGGMKSFSFSDITVSGSPSHELYLQKISARDGLDKLYQDYHVNNQEILDKVSAARTDKNQKLLSELYNTEEWKKFEQDEKNFFDTVSMTISKMVLDDANSWWGPFMMLTQMSYFTKEQEAWWNQFSDEAKGSYYGKIVFEELFPEGLKEKPAPEFSVTNDEGKELSLANLLEGKKYVLIDFWASWCKPCRNEIPNFKKAYETFSSKGFDIVSISTDKNVEDWKKALDEEKLPWPNFLDKTDISTLYKVKLIPTTYLVNDKGVIVEENLRGEALINKLNELMP